MGGEFKEEWIPVYVWLCLCCPPETTTVLLISYIPIQDKKFKEKKKKIRDNFINKRKKKIQKSENINKILGIRTKHICFLKNEGN